MRNYIKALPNDAIESCLTKDLYLTKTGEFYGFCDKGYYSIKPYLNVSKDTWNTKYRWSNGYYKFHYKGHMHSVHVELAANFVSGMADGLVVDHINNDSTDNRIENLQWITQSDNLKKRWAAMGKDKKEEYRKKYAKAVKDAHDSGKYDAHLKKLHGKEE